MTAKHLVPDWGVNGALEKATHGLCGSLLNRFNRTNKASAATCGDCLIQSGHMARWERLMAKGTKKTVAIIKAKASVKRTAIAHRSETMEAKMVTYRAQKKVWIARPDNHFCLVFPNRRATQIHHVRGRLGPLLLDERGWLPVSHAGHTWIDANREKARALGLLCEKGLWHVPFGKEPHGT